MIPPQHPRHSDRLAALRQTGLLDSPRESDFDEIAALAARICDAPVALISLVDADRQWFKAEFGLGLCETPLSSSVCAHAILQPGLTVVEDAAADPRLTENPLVTGSFGLRFYAGAPLETAEGLPLGTLCVLDTRPRELDAVGRAALPVLARQVMRQIELRMALREETRLREELEVAQARQAVLAREVDHRVKNSLQMVASLLRIQAGMAGSDEVADALDYAQERIAAVSRLHEALHASADIARIELNAFLCRIADHLRDSLPPGVSLDLELAPHVTDARAASSCGVVVNELVGNAVKHAFPEGEGGRIRVSGAATPAGYLLSVEDDGVGFTPDAAGQGLGLTLVRAAAHRLQTDLDQPPAERGTRWTLVLPPSGDAPAPSV